MKLIAKALIEAQKEMGNAVKDSVNPFFKSKYADLNSIREACMPALNKHGIAVLQPTVHIDGKNFVRTVLLHESGELFESMTEIIYNKTNDAQSQGSGITYARRYGLQSLVNVGAEDDDGNKASEPAKKQSLPELPASGDKFDKAKKFIQEGGSMEDISKKYFITNEVKTLLISK
tara:strand:+ start:2511 stop:3035 length:525 start_codon:yes stop_codon:yes gene_type:complete